MWSVQLASISFHASSKHIVRRHRTTDALERELTYRLNLHGVLNRHQHPGTDEYLAGRRFVAKARGDVGYRPDCGVVETSFKANGAERGKAVRYADAKTDVVA